MAEVVYILCAVTSVGCAVLLWRQYRERRNALLFWSTVCFAGLALNNVLLVIDLLVFPQIDLRIYRSLSALVAMVPMVFGLVWSGASND